MTEVPFALEALVLLDETRARAAIAWPLVTRHRKPAPGRVRAGAGPYWYSPTEWMSLADIPLMDHDKVADVLFRAGMCSPDGTVAKEVAAYARRLVLGRMKGAR